MINPDTLEGAVFNILFHRISQIEDFLHARLYLFYDVGIDCENSFLRDCYSADTLADRLRAQPRSISQAHFDHYTDAVLNTEHMHLRLDPDTLEGERFDSIRVTLTDLQQQINEVLNWFTAVTIDPDCAGCAPE